MKVRAVSEYNFSSAQNNKTDINNKTKKSNIGKAIGFIIGAGLGTGLVVSQIKSLKTLNGKKNLIESLQVKDKCLNDIERKVARFDEDGKIILYNNTYSERTQKVVQNFKKYLITWGGIITAICTAIGAAADNSINQVKERERIETLSKRKS